MADERDENLLWLEMEQITKQVKRLADTMAHIDQTLRTIADRLLRVGK